MPKNMGLLDRSLRIIAAMVLAALAFSGTVTGPLAIAAYVVAAVFLVTSVISFCPAYLPFGIRTCSKD